MHHVSSRDGTRIACERLGEGPAVILVGVSSGGAPALEAAAAGLPVGRIAVYEVP